MKHFLEKIVLAGAFVLGCADVSLETSHSEEPMITYRSLPPSFIDGEAFEEPEISDPPSEPFFVPSANCKTYARPGDGHFVNLFPTVSCQRFSYSLLVPESGVQLRFHDAFGEVDPCNDQLYFGPASLSGLLPGGGYFCYVTISPEAEECLCHDKPCQLSQQHRGWYQCGGPDGLL